MPIRLWRLVGLAGALLGSCLFHAAPVRAQGRSGPLFIVGGNFRFDNEALWRRFVDLAGGAGARIAVIPTAPGQSALRADHVAVQLDRLGAVPFIEGIAPRLTRDDPHRLAQDPAKADRIRSASGVFFVGNEDRITASLVTAEGQPTAVLEAIRAVRAKGGVIGGSGMGGSLLGRHVVRDPPPAIDMLKAGTVEGKSVARGLDLMESGWFVDGDVLTEGRFARDLVVTEALGYRKAIGVDENTALIIHEGVVEVAGHKGALVLDLSAARRDPAVKDFNLAGIRLTYLDRGDRYDLATGTLSLAPEKTARPAPALQTVGRPNPPPEIDNRIDPNSTDFKSSSSASQVQPDILGGTHIGDLMAVLISGRQNERESLAFTLAPEAKDPEKGFRFRFYRGKDSVGYYTNLFGGDDVTVANIYLDVKPVRMNAPLHAPAQ